MPKTISPADKERLQEEATIKLRSDNVRKRIEKENTERHVRAPENLSDLDIGQVFERTGV